MAARWRILALITLVRTSLGLQFQSIGALASYIEADLDLSKAEIGILFGIYLLPGIAIALPGGLFAQRLGDKRVVCTGLALMAVGGFWAWVAQDFHSQLAARTTAGVGLVIVNVLLHKMTTDWFAGREIVLAMSFMINAWPIGIGLAFVILGPLAQAAGWQNAMLLTGIAPAIGLVAMAALYRRPPSATSPSTAGVSFLTRRETGQVSLAGACWALYNAGLAVTVAFGPLVLIGRGWTPGEAGALFALQIWLFVASVQLGGLLAHRLRASAILVVAGTGVWAACLLIIAASKFAIVPIVLTGVFGGLCAAIFVSLPAEIVAPPRRAVGSGLFLTWYYVGNAAFPPLAGLTADWSGETSAALASGAIIMLITFPAFIALRVWQRRASATT